ncbi:Uncharacterised protein [Rodentibacter pneumotropicus]|uniref:Uncharacterized protein n=1 Tax=Rodentibacter pneumotropicus TaxID=758 RepID=A0A448MPJ0_9PAST|nr:Uncharacterised protein [Rodentibacter pneumotropicus]
MNVVVDHNINVTMDEKTRTVVGEHGKNNGLPRKPFHFLKI